MNIGSEPHNEPTVYNPFWAIYNNWGRDHHGTLQLDKFGTYHVPLTDVPEFVDKSSKCEANFVPHSLS